MGNNPNFVDPDGGAAIPQHMLQDISNLSGDIGFMGDYFGGFDNFWHNMDQIQGLDEFIGTGSSNPYHISNGANSHLVPSFGVSQDLGAIGTTTNGGLTLPQDFGSWNRAGSDGRQWIGCMSCHGNNGAYRTLAYDSPSRYAGLSMAATFNAAFAPGSLSSGSASTVRVGQWMTKAEYETFIKTGIIHRGNVLSKGSSGFSDKNLTHYVEFNVHPSILRTKDVTKGWGNSFTKQWPLGKIEHDERKPNSSSKSFQYKIIDR